MTSTLAEQAETLKEGTEKKRVKEENWDELPRSAQVYYLIHRAKEAGEEFATIPVRRGIAALDISLIKDKKRTYRQALRDIRIAVAMKIR